MDTLHRSVLYFSGYLTMKRFILILLAGMVLATSVHADIVVEQRYEGVYIVKIINMITESESVYSHPAIALLLTTASIKDNSRFLISFSQCQTEIIYIDY